MARRNGAKACKKQCKWILNADRNEEEIIHVMAQTCIPERKINEEEPRVDEKTLRISKQVPKQQPFSREIM